MKTQLNKELIEGLNDSNNEEFIDNINDNIKNLISCTIKDISEKSPFVKIDKCFLIPVNEIYLGVVSQLSEYTYFLGIENPQIEYNSKTVRNIWKNMWRDFKAAWRLGKAKYKKKKHKVEDTRIPDVTKYKIGDFRHDVVLNLSNYLKESSIIYENMNYISVIGKEDFGTNVKINIFICCYDSKKTQFKIYNERKNKYFIVDFGQRYINLQAKKKTCGKSFVDMVRVFNSIFSKVYNKIPNQILLESILYSCPKNLFDNDDVYKTFVNVANYIRLANPESFLSICNPMNTIFTDPLIIKTTSQVDYSKIISMLDKYKY